MGKIVCISVFLLFIIIMSYLIWTYYLSPEARCKRYYGGWGYCANFEKECNGNLDCISRVCNQYNGILMSKNCCCVPIYSR